MGERFDGILSSAYIGHSKDEPAFWEHLRLHGSAKPSETLVFDDEQENVDAAKAAGFTTRYS